MRENRFVSITAWWLALLLGQASLVFGIMVALGWALAFALILPHRASVLSTGPQLGLPVGPPLIGLAIGALGLMISRWSRQPIARFSIAGMAFNALSLALAALSIAACSAR